MFQTNKSSNNWNYYLDELWNADTDNRVSDLPLIGNGPWAMLIYMVIFLIVSTRISMTMEKREAYFMKPFQIVYYGFFFGIHGVAFPVVLALSKSPINTFRCNLNEYFYADLRGTMFIYAALLYLIIKLMNVFDVIILLWTKAANQITFGLMMETVLNPFILYGAIKYYPGGIICFPIVSDCLANSIKYGLSTRACASASIKPVNNWEQLIHYMKIFQYSMTTLHSIYTLIIPNCDAPIGLRVFFTMLHFFLAMAYSFDGGHFFYSNRRPSTSFSLSSTSTSSSSPSVTKKSTKVK